MNKRNTAYSLVAAMFLVLTVFAAQSDARIDINVGINVPAYRFYEPPTLVVIPGTYVYTVPDIDVDIFFYRGYWYRTHEDRWFRSGSYNGPWVYMRSERVPRVFFDLPADYRSFPPEHRRIPYREFNRNWRNWERDRYWDRDERWRERRREEGREERREERREEPRERERY